MADPTTHTETSPPALTAELAVSRASWLVEALGTALGVSCDPERTHRQARELVGARRTLNSAELLELVRAVARGSHLVLEEAQPGALDKQLPLAGLDLVVMACRGSEVLVHRADSETWEPAALVLGGPGPWLTATPAAPLAGLQSPAHHHATPWQRLAALMHLERDDLWVIAIYAAVVGLLTLAAPVAVQSLVTTVAFGTLLQPIVVLSLLLLTALSFQAALKALQARVVESVQERLFVRTAMDLAWRLPRVKREEAHDFGPEMVNRFFDVMTAQKTAATLLTDGLATVLQIGIGLLVLAFYHPALLAFALALVALLTALLVLPARRGLSTSISESVAKYEVAGWLEELARMPSAFRGAGAQFAVERADALTRRYLGARRKHFMVVYGQTVGSLGLQVLASAALLGLGGWLVVQRQLTLGQLIAAELIVAAVAASIAKLGKLLDGLYDLLTALDKLGHLVDLPTEDPERGEPVPGDGPVKVQLQGATDGDCAPLDLEIPGGARLAVTGAEGHPLGEWLAGLRLPREGAVVLNGVETARARTPQLRETLALVRRGDHFAGTILDNVTVGRPGISAAEARTALERVGLLDEVRALPEGLDTELAHDGAPLGPSQIARLLLARAMAGQPRLIVVDESLEVIEPLARARCVSALTRPGAPWTLVALVTEPSVALARGCSQLLSLDTLAPPRLPQPKEAAS